MKRIKLKKGLAAAIMLVCLVVGLIFFGRQVRLLKFPGTPRPTAVQITTQSDPESPPPEAEPPPEDETPPPETAALPEDETPASALAAPPEPLMASAHFAMEEYRCDCDGYCDGWPCAMDPELLDKIEALRCACGSPVIITSGVRCEKRNEEVGGITWSFHKRGAAADLYCPGMPIGQLAALAQEQGLNVLPYYRSGYLHVETV